MDTKRCWKCKLYKPLTEFSKDCHSPDGLQDRCKECDKVLSKKFHEANPDYSKIKGKERYDPSQNATRYAATRDNFLRRRKEYSGTMRGRLVTLLYSAKTRANKGKLDYDLDLPWLEDLFEAQNGCCLLTGIKLEFNGKKNGRYAPFSPSLDRISPEKGYVKENVRLVCTAINIAMNRFGENIFKQVAESYLNSTIFYG